MVRRDITPTIVVIEMFLEIGEEQNECVDTEVMIECRVWCGPRLYKITPAE